MNDNLNLLRIFTNGLNGFCSNNAGRYTDGSYKYNAHNFRQSRQRKILTEVPKHRIYPVFGKRRRRRSLESHSDPQVVELESKWDRIHFREHLTTRQRLFGKIEQLFQV